VFGNTCYLDQGRNGLVRWFLEETIADKFLSLDADISFVPRDLAQLDADEVDCVSGVYCNAFDGVVRPVASFFTDTEMSDEPLMEVEAVGAGFLLITRNLLEKMALLYEPPMRWFHEPIIDGAHFGEDFGFCYRLGEMGVPVHLDLRVQLSHYKTVRVTGPGAPGPPVLLGPRGD
jgi:GT2 family glycosyltransferase